MASKDTDKLGLNEPFDDSLELGNFSLDDLSTEINTSLKPGRHPVRDFTTSATRSFKDGFTAGNVIRSVLRASMPKGYVKAWLGAEYVWSEFKDIATNVRRQSANDIIKATERLETLMPRIRNKTPKRIYQKLDEYLQHSKGVLQSDIEMTRPGLTAEQRSKLRDDQALADVMAETMDFQHKVARTQDEAQELRFQKERAERAVKSKSQHAQFAGLVQLFGQANDSLGRLAEYNDQINYKFQRKQLEVQYRTYFAMRDIKALTAKALQLQAQAHKDLVRNTGLPDALKYTARERAGLGGNMTTLGAGGLAGFMAGYGGNMRNRLQGELSQRAQMLGLTSRLGGAAANMGGNPYESVGGLAGMKAGEFLRNTLIPAAARRAKPFVAQMSGRLGAQDEMLSYYMNNAPALMQDYANTDTARGGWRGGLKSMLRKVAPQYHLETRSTNTGYQNIGREGTFTQLTNRSITEVIPGLLSHIWNELTMTRTGRPSEPRTFDVVTGQFTTKTQSNSNLSERLVSKTARTEVRTSMDIALTKYDPDNKLSDGARRALKERLIRDSISNKHFDPQSYGNATTYGGAIDPAVRVELANHFNSSFKYDENGKFKSTAENNVKRNQMSKALLDLRALVKDPGAEVRRIAESGNEEQLRAMGLLTSGRHGDEINYDALLKLYLDDSGKPGTPGDKRAKSAGFGPTPGGGSGTPQGGGLRDRFDMTRPLTPEQVAELTDLASAAVGAPQAIQAQARELLAEHWRLQASTKASKYGDRAKGLFDQTKGKLNDMADHLGTDEHLDKLTSIASGAAPATEQVRAQAVAVLAEYWSKAKSHGSKAGEVVKGGASALVTNARTVLNGLVGHLSGIELSDKLKAISDGVVPATSAVREQATVMLGKLQAAGGVAKDGLAGVGNAAQAAGAKVVEVIHDIYVKGRDTPVLLARDIKAGKYFDLKSKRTITKPSDITGPVLDSDGNTVLSETDIVDGLVDPEGRESYLTKAITMASSIGGGVGGAIGLFTGRAMSVVRAIGFALTAPARVIDWLRRPKDLYVEGERSPRILGKRLRAGEYTNAWTGDVIKSIEDITGDVMDSDGEVVLRQDEITKLVDAKGKKIKRKGILRKMVGSYLNMSRKYYGWLGRKAMGIKGVEKATGQARAIFGGWSKWDGVKVSAEERGDPMLQLLAKMNDKLGRMAPPDERTNGWRDIFRNNAKSKEEKAKDAKDAKSNGALGGWGSKLAGLLGAFKKREGEGEEEEGGTNIEVGDIGGGGGGNEETEKERKRREKRERRLNRRRGKFGRALHGAKRFAGKAIGVAARVAVGLLGLGEAGAIVSGLGSAAMAIGSGALAVLSSPIVLTGLAVAAVGIGGYMLWNYYKANKDPLRQLRLAHYGVNPNNEAQAKAILNLESYYLKHTTQGANPSFETGKIDANEVASIMGIDIKNTEHVQLLGDYMERRFIPVFKKQIETLSRLAPNVGLAEIDDKLDKKLYKPYVEALTYATADSPLWVTSTPFGDTALSGSQELIASITKKVLDAGTDSPDATTVAAAVVGGAVVATKDAATSVANSPVGPGAIALKAAQIGGGGGITQAGRLPYSPFDGKLLNELQSIRFRAYGLRDFMKVSVNALFNLENEIERYVKVSAQGEASFSATAIDMLTLYGALFGIPTDATTTEGVAWCTWFESRFIPVVLARMSALKQLGIGMSPAQSDTRTDFSTQIVISNAIIGAKGTYQGSDSSVWVVPAPLFKDNTSMDLQRLAQVDLQILIDKAARERYAAPADAYTANNGKYADPAKTPLMMVNALNRANANNGLTPKEQADQARRTMGVTSIFGPSGIKSATGFGTGGVGPLAPGGGLSVQGNTAAFTDGNGGQWESIPKPEKDGDYNAAKPTIDAAAKMAGVDADLLATVIAVESGFRSGVDNGKSSAGGWAQFIDTTFKQQMDRHGNKYGIPKNATKYDPRVAALLGAEFMKENARILKAKLGRDPSDTDLYAAHFLGPGGASQFLKADSNAVAAQLFPSAASANERIFYEGTRARTVGEMYAFLEQTVAKQRKGGGRSATQGMPAGKSNVLPFSKDTAPAPSSGGPIGVMAASAAPVSGSVLSSINPAASGVATGSNAVAPTAPVAANDSGGGETQRMTEQADQVRATASAAGQHKAAVAQAAADAAGDMATLAQLSLNVQTETRDLLSTILSVLQNNGGQTKGVAQQPATQQSATPPVAKQTQSRPVANTPVPLVMRR